MTITRPIIISGGDTFINENIVIGGQYAQGNDQSGTVTDNTFILYQETQTVDAIVRNMHTRLTLNPTADTSGDYFGAWHQITSDAANTQNFTGSVNGWKLTATHEGDGDCTEITCLTLETGNLSATGNVTTGSVLKIPAISDSGGGVTTRNAILQEGSNDLVNFAGPCAIDNALTVNNSGNDVDFRVASTGNTHMLFVDASDNFVGIGKSAPTTLLHVGGRVTIDENLYVIGNVDVTGTLSTGVNQAVTLDGPVTINASQNNADFKISTNTTEYAFFINSGSNRVGLFNSNPQVTLDVNGKILTNDDLIVQGSFSTTQTTDTTSGTVTLNNINTNKIAQISYVGAATLTLTGFANPYSGKQLTIINRTGNPITIKHQSSSSDADNRIITGSAGLDVIIPNEAAIVLRYESYINRWHIMGGCPYYCYYGEMYMYDASQTITINTTSVPHMIYGYSTGDIKGMTFVSGGQIDADISNESNPSSNILRITTSAAHGLTTGDVVSQSNMNNAAHNGVTTITVVDTTNYDCDDITYVAGAGASSGVIDEGSYIEINSGVIGEFMINASISCAASVANKTFKWQMYKNSTALTKMTCERYHSSSDTGSLSINGIVSLVEGDRLFMTVENTTDATNIVILHSNIVVTKI